MTALKRVILNDYFHYFTVIFIFEQINASLVSIRDFFFFRNIKKLVYYSIVYSIPDFLKTFDSLEKNRTFYSPKFSPLPGAIFLYVYDIRELHRHTSLKRIVWIQQIWNRASYMEYINGSFCLSMYIIPYFSFCIPQKKKKRVCIWVGSGKRASKFSFLR